MYIGRNFRWKYNTRNKLAQKLFDYSVQCVTKST